MASKPAPWLIIGTDARDHCDWGWPASEAVIGDGPLPARTVLQSICFNHTPWREVEEALSRLVEGQAPEVFRRVVSNRVL